MIFHNVPQDILHVGAEYHGCFWAKIHHWILFHYELSDKVVYLLCTELPSTCLIYLLYFYLNFI